MGKKHATPGPWSPRPSPASGLRDFCGSPFWRSKTHASVAGCLFPSGEMPPPLECWPQSPRLPRTMPRRSLRTSRWQSGWSPCACPCVAVAPDMREDPVYLSAPACDTRGGVAGDAPLTRPTKDADARRRCGESHRMVRTPEHRAMRRSRDSASMRSPRPTVMCRLGTRSSQRDAPCDDSGRTPCAGQEGARGRRGHAASVCIRVHPWFHLLWRRIRKRGKTLCSCQPGVHADDGGQVVGGPPARAMTGERGP